MQGFGKFSGGLVKARLIEVGGRRTKGVSGDFPIGFDIFTKKQFGWSESSQFLQESFLRFAARQLGDLKFARGWV